MRNEEKKAKALEDEKKIQSSEKVTPEKEEEIISNEDAEKLAGGIRLDNEDLSMPSEGILGGLICCND